MMLIKALVIGTALAAAGAHAVEVAPATNAPGTVYRLSPDEIAKVDPRPHADPKLAYDPLFDRSLFDTSDFTARRDKQLHGEVGAFVGSGGANGVFGTVVAPLGDNGYAAFSFENSDYGHQRYYRRR